MSVIITYLNDNAQTPLNRFVVYMLYSQLCNKYSDISNRWNLGLSLSVAWSAVRAISSSLSLTTLFIAAHRVAWRIFSNSTVVHTKMGHMSKTMPLLGVICHLFVQNLRALASAIPEIWMGPPKSKTCHVT